MRYITGIIAFGVECQRNSIGKWNITKNDFLNEKLMELKESDESPFKDYGIEENKIVPYHDFCTYNVADHVRAYLDMLHEGMFSELKGLFYECIGDGKCRHDIFMTVYGKLRHLAEFKEVNEFMLEEFGNAWISYIDSVERVAEHIVNSEAAFEEVQKISNGVTPDYSGLKGGIFDAKRVPTIESINLKTDTTKV